MSIYFRLKFFQIVDFNEFQVTHPKPVLKVHNTRFNHKRVQQIDRIRAIV